MPLLSDLIDIPESVQRDDFVLKLTAGVADDAAAKDSPVNGTSATVSRSMSDS